MKQPAIAMLNNLSVKIHISSSGFTADERHLELSVNSLHRGELETISMMHKLGWVDCKSDTPLIMPHKLIVGNSTVESKAPIKWEIDGGLLKLTLDENIYKEPEHLIDLSSLATAMDVAFSTSRTTLEELGTIYVHDYKLWLYSVAANPNMYMLTDRSSMIFNCGPGQVIGSNNGIQVYGFIYRCKDTPFANKVDFELTFARENRLIKEWSEVLSSTHNDIGHMVTTAIKDKSK